ncbi:MAG TPA: helix-turn-helix transcriptional regulator, partial [Ruminococcus flavefaciens]|nr:helix-turn-helix transcriptional regulator [Ruminococcus flavefaciens]
MDKKNLFRKNLVKRRKELGLTQEQLAVRLNVSPQAVSK